MKSATRKHTIYLADVKHPGRWIVLRKGEDEWTKPKFHEYFIIAYTIILIVFRTPSRSIRNFLSGLSQKLQSLKSSCPKKDNTSPKNEKQ